MGSTVTALYEARVSIVKKKPGQWSERIWPLALEAGTTRIRLQRSLAGVVHTEPVQGCRLAQPACEPVWDNDELQSLRVTVEVSVDRDKFASRKFTLADVERMNERVSAAVLEKYPTPRDVPKDIAVPTS